MLKLSKLLPIVFLLALTGCDNDGPAENAGERIDDAIDNLRDQAEDVRDEVEEELDN